MSEKACQGILNRAKKRNKVLPKILESALINQANHSHNNTNGDIKLAKGVVSKGSDEAFLTGDKTMSLSTGGGQAGQGYPCVLETRNDLFRKSAHAQNSEEGQGWEDTDVNDTLNAFDHSENRTPTLVVSSPKERFEKTIPEKPICMTVDTMMKIDENEVAFSLLSRDYKDPQCVVYGISAFDSNAMKSDNPNSGIYEADTARTLDLNGGNPVCNQGGMVVIEGNGQRGSHKGDGFAESDVMYTLNTVEQHAVCYGLKESAFYDAYQYHGYRESDTCGTLTSDQNQGIRGDTPLVIESND